MIANYNIVMNADLEWNRKIIGSWKKMSTMLMQQKVDTIIMAMYKAPKVNMEPNPNR